MLFVKICGLTNINDALAAVKAGADALGFVFADSPRRVKPAEAKQISAALPEGIIRVGVFVSPPPERVEEIMAETGLDLAQIHGEFPNEGWERLGNRAIRGVRVGFEPANALLGIGKPRYLLLDAYQPGMAGGTGKSFVWSEAEAYRGLGLPLLVAGGLNPFNVQAALKATHPDGVDVSSGVEAAPGHKDHRLLHTFIAAVREWELAYENPA